MKRARHARLARKWLAAEGVVDLEFVPTVPGAPAAGPGDTADVASLPINARIGSGTGSRAAAHLPNLLCT